MKLKSVLLLAVALVCGLVAMLGVQQALSSNRSQPGMGDYGQVLVAKTEIPPGTPLTEKNVKFQKWPRAAIPPGAVTKKEEYERRAVKVRTYPGEIIMKAQLGEKGQFGAAASIPKGMRVISVPVDPTMTNSGLIWPGCHVDVFVTYKSLDRRIGTEIATVLEDVEVFAIDSNRDLEEAEQSETKAKTISLLVTPEQAMRLKRAEEMGHLHVAMRGAGDDSRVHTALRFDQVNAPFEPKTTPASRSSGLANAALLAFLNRNDSSDEKTEEEPKESAPRTWKIRIYCGGEERVEEVELPESEQSTVTLSCKKPEQSNPLLGYLKRALTTP